MSEAQAEPVPFYKTVKTRFQDLDVSNGVDVDLFCSSCDAVIAFFDLFSNAPFAIVRADLASKIAILRASRQQRQKENDTLEAMLSDEKKANATKLPGAMTGALTWLLRSLRFTSMGLRRNMSNETEEVSTSMTWAYGQALKPYHGWAVRPLFLLAMKAVPYRQNFYLVLGTPVEEVMVELDAWLTGLEVVLRHMNRVYAEGKYGSIDGKP